jgi:hypothetical protein
LSSKKYQFAIGGRDPRPTGENGAGQIGCSDRAAVTSVSLAFLEQKDVLITHCVRQPNDPPFKATDKFHTHPTCKKYHHVIEPFDLVWGLTKQFA